MQGRKLAVIIPFFEGHGHIQACTQSVVNSQGWESSDLVLVVDNSPTRFKQSGDQFQVEVIETQPGIGFGKANNMGFEYAEVNGFDLACILNQDAVLAPDALKCMTESLKGHPDFALVAPMLYRYDFKSIEAFFIQHYLVQSESLIYDMLQDKKLKDLYQIHHLSGACMLAEVKILSKTGFFDPVYHMYEEDQDLSRRLSVMGFQIGLVPGAKLGHLHSNTDEEVNLYVLKQRSRSAFIYECKDTSRGFLHNVTIGIRKQMVLMTMLFLDLKIKSFAVVLVSFIRSLLKLFTYYASYKAEKKRIASFRVI